MGGCRSTKEGLRIWAHHGQPSEKRALERMVAKFNAAHPKAGPADLTFFPDFQYAEKLAAAAAAGDLPDTFELDGPSVATFAHARLLAPLDGWLPSSERGDFLPTVLEQGTISGTLYALGAFDSSAVLYFDREMFRRAGIVEPPWQEGFAWDDLIAACKRLEALGVTPLALHMNEAADEWFTYAFSPIIWSNGGALIDRNGWQVRKILASSVNQEALRCWQQLFNSGYAAADPIEPNPFGLGRAAMDWSGHWMLRSHSARKGEGLGVMPLPRVGPVRAAACGSWCWSIASQTPRAQHAGRWLRWVTGPEHGVRPLVLANGAIPSRKSVLDSLPEYAKPPASLLVEQLLRRGRPRPRTPYYATLSQHLAAALRDIAHGQDVASRLQRAEDDVARVIERRRAPLGERAG